MRILLTLFILLSASAFAQDEKSIKDLFANYDKVMDQKKFDLIDRVFTKKFIRESGGKESLISKIKTLPTPKTSPKSEIKTRKGARGNMYFAKVKEASKEKSKDSHEANFVILKEDGKLKIDGTLSDLD